ncbi:NAD-dependent epimerase/dehydratase family protein [Pragia fontium]|uniref:Nucleoside-diphosphate-sugar epimerase n=2 Tax=Pragia fontium TaxID=82985 RepID=A0AAJ4WBH7_9GAMM|nr:NAD(P)-dependent oxidoreductase [Pragia fontium]GKX63864.1 CDP-abequose synthase [Pragia fontium]SFD04326.1 Nucleoside-diphosphate-sugar epimerase [Pragia fontium DSM 5563 = ATCC 49100]VEJ56171.1 NAD dependent epimerase/dehydratase family [Pragia fontium]
MKKKVILTGATGFIGYNLTKKLKESGYIVGAFVRDKNYKSKFIDYIRSYHESNVFSSTYEEFKPDITIHLATSYKNDVNQLIDSNILLPIKLLDEISKQDAKKRKFISTASYWQLGDKNTPNIPLDNYASSKDALYSFLKQYSYYSNVDIVELFIYGTYGTSDGRGKVLDYILDCAKSDIKCELSKGEQVLNLVHVDDVCNAYMLSIKRLLEFNMDDVERYGVYSKCSCTLKDIVSEVNKSLGREFDVDFGAKSYRDREIFFPQYPYGLVPEWRQQIGLFDYINKSIKLND